MITSNTTDGVSRRDFIKCAAVAIGGLITTAVGIPSIAYLLSPGLKSAEDDAWVDLGDVDRYPIGEPKRFDFTRTRVSGWERKSVSYGAFVVRPDGEHVRVFSDICTHLGCRVSWHANLGHYVSPCHDGHFGLLGDNVSGPPPRPLDEFATRIEDGRLWIQLPPIRRNA
jgi:menaquinol-cytochrome c reductase iron-sulfur subunit